jgi:NADP-dependent 3-hydroxy acid dehydrogenase YdfG
VASGVWEARYPDLAGKVGLVTGDHRGLVEVVRRLAANGAPVGVVAADRARVDAALAATDGQPAMGVVSDPADPGTWERVIPHAEQRLGPIDVVVAMGSDDDRRAVLAAVLPDMTARGRGVIVEVSEAAPPDISPAAIRHRYVTVGAAVRAEDIAAVVTMCASDVLSTPAATVRLADRE